MHSTILVGELAVELTRKDIKHAHLRIYPPEGIVRISAPLWMDDASIRAFVLSKLEWIGERQRELHLRPGLRGGRTRLEFSDGEAHLYRGAEHGLKVVEGARRGSVCLAEGGVLELRVRSGAAREDRERLLDLWYRRRLAELVPPILEEWQERLGVRVAFWGIKKMKTRWGTCNNRASRVWLNLELAKKPPACLEYVVVHELVHLIELSHGPRFKALMDRYYPRWRSVRKELND
ncbi:MAG: M48 family peptidase [Spirochaetales bacterium]|nr:MAG: M48 family peptidase [Spirochaetales bacterium]